MELLLTGAATFLLESAAGVGIDKGVDTIAKHLSNKALLKTDEKVREYLQKHISEYDYEKIDRFLGKEGIYAHDQASCIHYRFVGCLQIPEWYRRRKITLESRQGVAVNYLPTTA